MVMGGDCFFMLAYDSPKEQLGRPSLSVNLLTWLHGAATRRRRYQQKGRDAV
jgi:hypothetical protein